jgi:hypothetical protein
VRELIFWSIFGVKGSEKLKRSLKRREKSGKTGFVLF